MTEREDTRPRAFSQPPQSDEKATVTLSAKVPKAIDVPLNPDGTRPEVTIVATGDTYLSLLQSLATLHEDINPVLEALTIELLTAEEAGRYSSLEEAGPLLRERFAEIVVPFRTHTVAFEIGGGGDLELAITAPSAGIGAQALQALTKPNVLTQIAISYSPETDEDEESGNHVLVV